LRKTLERYKQSTLRQYLKKNEKSTLVIFFIGGFVFDSLTLSRIDRLYDLIVLSLYMVLLTLTIVVFNLADDEKWTTHKIGRYKAFYPFAIQFFFGGLSSAYVIYFSKSVSLSKTAIFFFLLIALLLANQFLKKRLSNKYLHFGMYTFIGFIFFASMIPVFTRQMNTTLFYISGFIALTSSIGLGLGIYFTSPSTREETHLGKLIATIVGVFIVLNTFYHFRLIPPVPLALNEGIAAHDIKVSGGNYLVSYETDAWYIFWRKHRLKYVHRPDEKVYVFASIFAPTDLKKSIYHKWTVYDEQSQTWLMVDKIGYTINGGRDNGFRGYTVKSNVRPGKWKVEVITDDELVIGIIDFEIIEDPTKDARRLVEKAF